MRRFDKKTSGRFYASDRVHSPESDKRAELRRIRREEEDAEFAEEPRISKTDPLGSCTGVARDGGRPVQDADDL